MGWLTSDPDRCLLLADLVVTVHFGIVAFVLLGALAIPLGGYAHVYCRFSYPALSAAAGMPPGRPP